MCTDHARTSSVGVVPTVTRIPLRRAARRLSRRRLLFDAGIGTAGIAILGACSSSGGGTAVVDSTAAPTQPSVQSTAAPTTVTPADASADAAAGASLELAWVEFGFVSAYVLVRGGEAAIVDTGTDGSGAAIEEALSSLGLVPGDVRHIVLTHNHGDHVGGLGELQASMVNATVSAGPGDVDTIQTSLALQEVGDGDEVFGLGVVGTPGHTAGSISVFDTDTGLLVAGDALNGDGSGGLIGANERFTADLATAGDSIAKMAALAPSTVAFGHGGAPVDVDAAAKLTALAG